MRRVSILAIDAGTTGVTALVVTEEGSIAAKGYQEFPQHFPKPGWVEHAPEEIWQATLEAARDCLPTWTARRRPRRRRHHQPARDGAALGPRDAGARRAARSCGRTGVRPTSAGGCATRATRTG